MTRECGTCTKCCDGWLTGSAKGYNFWPGRKCHFVCSTGCTIYEDRPKDPCQSFTCSWLDDENIPAWLKPNESNVIMQWRTLPDANLSHLEIVEAGAPMSAEVLSWVIMYALNKNINLAFQVNGGWNKIGNQTFLQTEIKIA